MIEKKDHSSGAPELGPQSIKRCTQIAAFGALLEQIGSHCGIRDSACLPCPKSELLEALLVEIALEPESRRRDALGVSAVLLCEFQAEIGPTPLDALGLGGGAPPDVQGIATPMSSR